MKHPKFLLFACLLFLSLNGISQQNLVPNPSFESYNTLQCDWVQDQIQFSSIIQDWTIPTLGTSDILSELLPTNCELSTYSTDFHAVGPQQPRTGSNMAGICTFHDYQIGNQTAYDGYREYLQVPLSTPLVVGETYHVEFFVSRGEGHYYAANNIGAYFSDTMVNLYILYNVVNFGPLFYTPHINDTNIIVDSTGWTRISGCYQATSPSEYLIIGNFYGNSSTDHLVVNNTPMTNDSRKHAYYFVDDVTVSTEPSGFVVSDNDTICQQDSIQLLASGGSSYSWDNGATSESITVSPDSTTTYQVVIADGQCIATRDVTIYVTSELNATLDWHETTLSTQSYDSYQWLDCNNNFAPIPGATNQSFSPTMTGSYAVEVNQGGCIDTTECQMIDFTSIYELNQSEKKLVKITDLMGREVPPLKNQVLIYFYSDGTAEQHIEME